MIIGERIKELRLENKVSVIELAKAIGVDQRAIRYWESGKYEPRADYVASLAKFFMVSADYLLGLTDN